MTISPDPYDNYDRRILEDFYTGNNVRDVGIVVVKCPHRIGLCYQGEPAKGMGEDWLMRLPCPCNDKSVVVAHVLPLFTPDPQEGAAAQ